jgi:hypothetical protein
MDRYVLSGSARWDGSNLLGVKTNQRGILLWSAGASWEISKEVFYSFAQWLSYLRLRLTQGSGGLIDKSQSQYPTISLSTDARTNLPMANLNHPGNPSLSWERVSTTNLGLDFTGRGQWLSGSLELYHKAATNLLGSILIDPTTGAGANYKRNYADLSTKGFDLQLNSININHPLRWESNLLISYSSNQVRNYSTPALRFANDYFTSSKPPTVDRSIDAVYALPWNGLDHNTGLPVIYVDGKVTTDYAGYYSNFKPDDLVLAGVSVAPLYGSLRNSLGYKGFQLSAMIGFKTGYVFRRNSMAPGAEYVTGPVDFHTDYFKRWQQPGDEQHTNVPAGTPSYNSSLANAYNRSMTLITSGSHIRLQDLNFSYTLPSALLGRLRFSQARIFANVRNLGLIWAENNHGIDPEYPYSTYPAPRSIAFGVQVSL